MSELKIGFFFFSFSATSHEKLSASSEGVERFLSTPSGSKLEIFGSHFLMWREKKGALSSPGPGSGDAHFAHLN